jgi:hypothetical protein
VPLLLLFFFSLGQERELSDVSEWAGPTRCVLVRLIVLSVTGDRAGG